MGTRRLTHPGCKKWRWRRRETKREGGCRRAATSKFRPYLRHWGYYRFFLSNKWSKKVKQSLSLTQSWMNILLTFFSPEKTYLSHWSLIFFSTSTVTNKILPQIQTKPLLLGFTELSTSWTVSAALVSGTQRNQATVLALTELGRSWRSLKSYVPPPSISSHTHTTNVINITRLGIRDPAPPSADHRWPGRLRGSRHAPSQPLRKWNSPAVASSLFWESQPPRGKSACRHRYFFFF